MPTDGPQHLKSEETESKTSAVPRRTFEANWISMRIRVLEAENEKELVFFCFVISEGSGREKYVVRFFSLLLYCKRKCLAFDVIFLSCF
jgi:hypothetical protein